jgi:hypothetical protein
MTERKTNNECKTTFFYFQLQIALLYFSTLSAGVAVVAFAFTAFTPKYRCRIPNCENSESGLYNNAETKEPFDFVQMSIGTLSDGKATIGKILLNFWSELLSCLSS